MKQRSAYLLVLQLFLVAFLIAGLAIFVGLSLTGYLSLSVFEDNETTAQWAAVVISSMSVAVVLLGVSVFLLIRMSDRRTARQISLIREEEAAIRCQKIVYARPREQRASLYPRS